MLLREVKEKFASTSKNSIREITGMPSTAKGYIVRESLWYGVGVPFDGGLVAESFANARIRSAILQVGGEPMKLLLLECCIEEVRNQFAAVCAEFLSPGVDNRARHQLVSAPLMWWKKWRELLGNTIYEKTTYQILGELLALEYLLRTGAEARWQGAAGNTKDIATDFCNYEVKSTLSRYATQVTISSKFQLVANDKPLKLVFVRFEPSASGDTLAKAVQRLCDLGYRKDSLLRMLARQGVEPGNISFSTGYNLLEMRFYDVDESFPVICDASFVGGHIPQSVIDFTYTIDLVGVPYTSA